MRVISVYVLQIALKMPLETVLVNELTAPKALHSVYFRIYAMACFIGNCFCFVL